MLSSFNFLHEVDQMQDKIKDRSIPRKRDFKIKMPNTDFLNLVFSLLLFFAVGSYKHFLLSLLPQRVENSILVPIIYPNNLHIKHPKHLLNQSRHYLLLYANPQNQNQPIYFVACYLELLCPRLSITKTEMFREIICRS